jgi:hypothetical protein
MKKIFILLVCSASSIAATAEYGPGFDKQPRNERDVVFNADRRPGRNNNADYFNRKREMDMQVERINREYDRRVDAVHNRWFMNRAKRERTIYMLEQQRREEIRRVYDVYGFRYNGYDDCGPGRRW